jgi:hypothetical protein
VYKTQEEIMADIQTLLGDSYREGMTVDEINAALSNKSFVDPSTLPKSVEKGLYDRKVSELSAANKELKQLKEAGLTDEDKANAAIQEAESTKKQYATALNKLSVEKLFVSEGLQEDDYKDLIDNIISEDSEKTKMLANEIISIIKKQKESLRAEMLKGNPKPKAGEGSSSSSDYNKLIQEAQKRGDWTSAAFYTRMLYEEKTN